MNQALEELTEETARQIIWIAQPGASDDPLTAVKQMLYAFLDAVQEQQYQEALQQHWRDEQDQQN